MLELYNMLEAFMTLLELMPHGFPSKLDRQRAQKYVDKESIQWFVDHNILSTQTPGYYGLVDEFLRIRFILDQAENSADEQEIEQLILAEQEMIRDEEEDHDQDR
jgi:hypothetical protein